MRGYRFWVLVVFFFTAGVPSGLIPNVVPMLTDGGMTVAQAVPALAAAFIGLAGGA